MGQSGSHPERHTEEGGRSRLRRGTSIVRRSMLLPLSDEVGVQDGLLSEQGGPRRGTRQASTQRLSQLFPNFNSDVSVNEHGDGNHRQGRAAAALHRTRSTFRDMLGSRDRTSLRSRDTARPSPGFLQHRTSYVQAAMNSEDADYQPPRIPSMDLNSTFDNDLFDSSRDAEAPAPRSSSSNRRQNLRLASLRPDRPFRHWPSLRRRRSPPPAIRRIGGVEDQAAMLSRLLSVAAAATAATLMGDDHHALSEARSLTGGTGVGDIGAGGEDGSFDGFLRALQNGRIASALRGGSDVEADSAAGPQGPLNFFRMFRFGAAGAQPANQGQSEGQAAPGADSNTEGRMVPIIIVGIRSIQPGSGPNSGSNAEDLPPFIDALGSFPSPLPTHALGTHGHDSIDSILRPPQNGTSFRHRRRASMGAFGLARNRLSDRMDDQRDHRSPDRRRERPWSVASSSSAFEPRPPPATPASPSPELSRISSRNSTPAPSRPASFVANSMRDFATDSRRNSALHRASGASPLSSHTEETMSLHSTHSSTNLLSQSSDTEPFRLNRRSDTAPNIHYPRFASGHPRRNGVVEPDNLPALSRSSTSAGTDSSGPERRNSSTDSRSWIIYVLGGSYPENHPILTTPSLFTENPTYEDMMLLSALLGPAKAPVASEEDVESAGGIFIIEPLDTETLTDTGKTAILVAAATESEERIPIESSQRCLVCLCDFEVKEVARKLVKCNHLFHKECIDQVSGHRRSNYACTRPNTDIYIQWLTQGRNSCPLCRGQGVDEKEKATETSSNSDAADPDASAGASLNDSVDRGIGVAS